MFYFKWYLTIAIVAIVCNTLYTLRNYRPGFKFPRSWELWFGFFAGLLWIIAIPAFILDWLAIRDIIPLYDRK